MFHCFCCCFCSGYHSCYCRSWFCCCCCFFSLLLPLLLLAWSLQLFLLSLQLSTQCQTHTRVSVSQNDGILVGRPAKAPGKGRVKGLDSRPDDGQLLLAALQQYLAREPAPGPASYGNRPRPFPSSKANGVSVKEGMGGYRGWAPQGPADGTQPGRAGADRLLFKPATSQLPAKDPLSLVDGNINNNNNNEWLI